MDERPLTEQQIAASITSLLAEIDAVLATVPELLAEKRHGPRRAERVQGPRLQRRRLELLLAQAALLLAQAAVAGLPTAALAERVAAIQPCLGQLQRLGQGSIEVRTVVRAVSTTTTDPATGARVPTVEHRPFGPYAYYRWSEGKKVRSLYLGRADAPAEWSWKLVELGADLDALGLPAEAAAHSWAAR